MAKSKYLNADRREDVYWAGALQGYLEKKTKYYDGEALKWLKSTILSLECFLRAVLNGIEPKEKRAIENMIDDLTPTIQVNKLAREGPEFVTIDADTLYDLAEQAIDLCKHDCIKDYGNCKRREMFLKLGIPAYVELGACQYERLED